MPPIRSFACHVALVLAACLGKVTSLSAQDTTFAAMQYRGKEAMGVDQYTSSHIFESLPDGGRIVLRRDVADSAGVAAIRSHMRYIAERFAAGDFALPGFVHAQEVPGTRVMTEGKALIAYVADTLPRGGEVRIVTGDAASLEAVHAFLEFQRHAHHAAGHDHAAPPR
jgi:hypothetical protein